MSLSLTAVSHSTQRKDSMERINGWEIAGKVLKTAHDVGSFVMGHLRGGAWGETASNIQPPHVNVEHQLGDE